MIMLKDVVKTYNKGTSSAVTALNGINLVIEDGEFVSIMGPSGSGKSTLLHILGCMDTMTEGEYELDDIKIHKQKAANLHKIRGAKISFVFQQFALMNAYTVFENVELPLLAQNVKKKGTETNRKRKIRTNGNIGSGKETARKDFRRTAAENCHSQSACIGFFDYIGG